MATRDAFSEEELAQLRGFPEITRAELIRYFTPTPADEAFVRRFHGRRNTLGAAVQMCTLPWLGFVPDDVTAAPSAAVARLSERLDIPSCFFAGWYGQAIVCDTPGCDAEDVIVGPAGWWACEVWVP